MSYNISIFKNLLEKFPEWSQLEAYLTSPEGGQLRVVGEDKYRIIRYVKGISTLDSEHVQWMRSVVWNTETNRPLCVAPPKAKLTQIPSGELVVEDFLDGIMINVFKTEENPTVLQVATRTQIGAGGTFYSTKSFANLFQEVKGSGSILSLMGQYTFASFVLRHPEHRVVERVRYPYLHCVHAGWIEKDGRVHIEEKNTLQGQFEIPVYPISGFASEKDRESYFTNLVQSKGWTWQGLTLKDGKGGRWRLRNPNYMILRGLRGAEATPVERFLRLRAQAKVSEYLKHYHEERQIFWDLEQDLRKKTKEVFDGYCIVHKSHQKKLADLPKLIQPFVFRLHSHYLDILKPLGEKVSIQHAIETVNTSASFELRRLLLS